jgi:ABC-type antimicrobial peptide transport system permease subunit
MSSEPRRPPDKGTYGQAGTGAQRTGARCAGQLDLRKIVQLSWRNIRQRLGRSALVTVGIILALAFLSYILCSEAIASAVMANADEDLVESLVRKGMTSGATDADARIQTRWMVTLALLVSFVGIFNAMLLSVTERFKEIGTMKCLGALDSLVMKLFLLESAFQGLVGTLVGILVGVTLALIESASLVGGAVWGLMPYSALARYVVICLLAGTVITVVAALYPAWRASRMQPVEAMRMEV